MSSSIPVKVKTSDNSSRKYSLLVEIFTPSIPVRSSASNVQGDEKMLAAPHVTKLLPLPGDGDFHTQYCHENQASFMKESKKQKSRPAFPQCQHTQLL